VPGGQLQLPHFPVSSDPEAVIFSLFPLAQVPAGHEQLPHFPVSPATVKLHKELHSTCQVWFNIVLCVHDFVCHKFANEKDTCAWWPANNYQKDPRWFLSSADQDLLSALNHFQKTINIGWFGCQIGCLPYRICRYKKTHLHIHLIPERPPENLHMQRNTMTQSMIPLECED